MKKKSVCGIYNDFPKIEGERYGGLRTKGIVKKSTSEYPLVTYITVTYNCKNTLLACMESIWSQAYPNIEHIIIDGESTDGTVDLIEEHKDKIDYYISQPDNGIYNAMNKGVMLANGELICFMNADDSCTPQATEIAVRNYKETKADIICGNRKLCQNENVLYEIQYPRYSVKRSVFRYVQMFHQSTYATREVFNKVGYFEEEYSLIADWVWQSKAIDAGFNVQFIEEELSIFNYGGASSKGIIRRDVEWEKWGKKIFPELKENDLRLFIYTLGRGRHPLFDAATINKVAFKYFFVDNFKETYYYTMLVICREQCTDIMNICKNDKDYVDKEIQKNFFMNKKEIANYGTLLNWLDNRLVGSARLLPKEITVEVLNDLSVIKDGLNKIFYKSYIKSIKETEWKIDKIYRIIFYSLSRLISHSVFCSSKFYVIMRTIWYFCLKVRYVEK